MGSATIKHTRDATANDSDKVILTVSANKLVQIQQIHVVLVSTATAGNRQLIALIRDENDTLVADFHAGATQAASLTRHYVFAPGIYRETSFVDGSIQVAIPNPLILLPGWDLRIYDSGAVDAAADDMTVDVVYKESNIMDVSSI